MHPQQKQTQPKITQVQPQPQAQPMDQIDKIRNDFFDMVLQQEEEKRMKEKLVQTNCFHQYSIIGVTYHNGKERYQERSCSKCFHSDIRSIKVWEGTKLGKCSIM